MALTGRRVYRKGIEYFGGIKSAIQYAEKQHRHLTEHEKEGVDIMNKLMEELPPVVVAKDASADEMNKLHGERYGFGWVYPATEDCPDPAGCAREGCNKNLDGAMCDRVAA